MLEKSHEGIFSMSLLILLFWDNLDISKLTMAAMILFALKTVERQLRGHPKMAKIFPRTSLKPMSVYRATKRFTETEGTVNHRQSDLSKTTATLETSERFVAELRGLWSDQYATSQRSRIVERSVRNITKKLEIQGYKIARVDFPNEIMKAKWLTKWFLWSLVLGCPR